MIGTLWRLVSPDARSEILRGLSLAERTSEAMGATPPRERAGSMTPNTDAAQLDTWESEYDPEAARVGGPPLGLLALGLTIRDAPQAVVAAIALAGRGYPSPDSAPSWSAVLADAARRAVPAAVVRVLDEWAAVGGQYDRGTGNQPAASRAWRHWWSERLRSYAVRSTAPTPTPTPTPNYGSSSSSGNGAILAAAALFVVGSRRGRRGRRGRA